MTKNRPEPKPPTWRQKSKLSTFLLLIAAVIFVYFFTDEETPAPAPSQTGFEPVELVRVHDGDTIWVKYEGEERKIRYLLVDTPELNHKEKGTQPFAKEAKNRNEELLKSGQIEIEFDVGDKEDKYGRLLAYVYVDGESVQEKLIAEGLARVGYIYEPNSTHLESFKAAEEQAKNAETGIWSIEDYVTNRGFVQ